ncbi:MAG: TonB family protein [Azoarcus sp.]|jgi:protein TonB|nr:TonB family protein [Azoarcus sp.]
MATNSLWFGLALLLHAALLLAIPRGAAQVTPPTVVLAVSLIDAPVQAAAPLPAAPPKATPPKPRPPKPERPKRVTRKTRTVPVQESRIRIPDPVEAAEPAESEPEPAPQVVAAVSATPSSGASTESNADAQASGPFTAAIFDADYLHNPRPSYPAMSRRLHEEGMVTLRAHVLPDGSADKVVINKSSGSARLDETARAAVAKWRFKPARQGDKPVASWVLIPFIWSLEKS